MPEATTACPSAEMLSALADGLSDAVAIVDAEGRLEFANRPMRHLLRRAKGVRVANRRLAPRDAQDAPLLDLVHDAATRGVRRFGRWDEEDGRVFEVCAHPLPRADRKRGASGLTLLLVRDTSAVAQVDLDYLGSVFGLTVTESRLTRALCNGASIEAAANELSISKETARTHLKRVYNKTGARRQVDLVRLVSRGLHTGLAATPPGGVSSTTLNAVRI